MIKNIDQLAKFVKGGADVLQKALESKEEISIELNEGSFVSNEELETLKTTVRAEGKKEGHSIGYDFAVKDFKAEFGLDIEGKDRKVIASEIQKKIINDAKIEPNKRIGELEGSLSKLQKQYETDIAAKDNEVKQYQSKVKDIKINSDLAMSMPEGLNIIKPDQFALLARSNYEFDYDEGGQLVAKKGGNVLKDKLEKPLPVKEILTEFATTNNWLNVSGRGGGNQGGGNSSDFKSINDVYRHMESNKIDPTSPEGQKLVDSFKNSQK